MNTNNYVIAMILFVGFLPLGWYIGKLVAEWIIAKAKVDLNFKNEMASITYMIISFAPPICSFAVISAITASDEKNATTLFIIFIIGLVINHFGRKLRNELFSRTTNEIPGFKKSDFLKVMRGKENEN